MTSCDWRDSGRIHDTSRLDDVCALLQEVCRHLNGDEVELSTRRDGRVEIRVTRGPFTTHIGRADLLPDAGEVSQMPSAELCDMLDGLRGVR
jgi:hypothetical protein